MAAIIQPIAKPPTAMTAWVRTSRQAPSLSSPSATFGLSADGLTIPFTLGQQTAFPNQFAVNPGDPGAIPSLTAMRMQFRVAPGVITDTDTFWGNSVPGAIDLATLTIQSDADFNVTASLTIGSSTSDFLVNSTDPAAAVAAIENAFAGNQGTLLSDLTNVFSVSFIPQAGVSEYTVGSQSEVDLGAWEPAPEPATALLLAIGGTTLCLLGGRRRMRVARKRSSRSMTSRSGR